MDEILTLAEMKARYAPDWALIGEPQLDEQQRLLGGKLLFHSPDRDEVYRKALGYPEGRYAFRCLAEVPENLVLVL